MQSSKRKAVDDPARNGKKINGPNAPVTTDPETKSATSVPVPPLNYLFEVHLLNVNTTRTLSIPAKYTFQQFHRAIQVAFEWGDDHAYSFKKNLSSVARGYPYTEKKTGSA